MAKYKHRPVTIDAERYAPGMEDGWGVVTEDGAIQFHADTQAAAETWFEDFDAMAGRVAPLIKALEGWHVIESGEWIVSGVAGERYPMKDQNFQMTYEPVDPEKEAHQRSNPELRRFIDESGLV
jgi:hypothetical protein